MNNNTEEKEEQEEGEDTEPKDDKGERVFKRHILQRGTEDRGNRLDDAHS